MVGTLYIDVLEGSDIVIIKDHPSTMESFCPSILFPHVQQAFLTLEIGSAFLSVVSESR